jgi:hypothetical protein
MLIPATPVVLGKDMTEMVARVAQAIIDGLRKQAGEDSYDLHESGKVAYIDQADVDMHGLARTVIAAMREPNEAMSSAGDEEAFSSETNVDADRVYSLMIDAALK